MAVQLYCKPVYQSPWNFYITKANNKTSLTRDLVQFRKVGKNKKGLDNYDIILEHDAIALGGFDGF